jgi:hypothetical protein
MSTVTPFRFPSMPAQDLPLQGAEREAAIETFRQAAPVIAAHAVGKAFSALSQWPACRGLGCEDFLPLFVEAFRHELSKIDYCEARP